MKIQSRFWYALAGLLVCIGIDVFFHQLILQRIAVLLGLILVVGYFWAAFSLRGILFIRKSRFSRFECGEVFEEDYEIRNDYFLPKLWIQVEDGSDLPSKPAGRTISQIRAHTSHYFQSLVILSKRGEFALGPTILHSGDPFGFFHRSLSMEPKSSILVLPLIFPLERDWNPKGDLSGGKAHREQKSLSSQNATAVREYQPGDALNKIHWKSSVRAQKWMVKEFEREPLANIWLILDCNASGYFSYETKEESDLLLPRDIRHYQAQQILPRDNFEYAVSAAASLIEYFTSISRGVGLLVSGEKLVSIFPEKGNRQRTVLFEALTYVKAVPHAPLSTVIQSQSARINKGNAVIIITSLLEEELLNSFGMLHQKGVNILLVYVDPHSFSGISGGNPQVKSQTDPGIPTLVIRYGDDLGRELAEAI
jgi:uncharacterized protein (DUF58 family)